MSSLSKFRVTYRVGLDGRSEEIRKYASNMGFQKVKVNSDGDVVCTLLTPFDQFYVHSVYVERVGPNNPLGPQVRLIEVR